MTHSPHVGGPIDPSGRIVSFSLDAAFLRPAPVSTGIPLPRGRVRETGRLRLASETTGEIAAQFEPLAHWFDGSLRAVRLDFLAHAQLPAGAPLHLIESDAPVQADGDPPTLTLRDEGERLVLESSRHGKLTLACPLTISPGDSLLPRWEAPRRTEAGPVRQTLEIEGRWPRTGGTRIRLRLSTFTEVPLIEARVTLHNPRRARHPGGLWDLGDANSLLFHAFQLIARRDGPHKVRIQPTHDGPALGPFETVHLYQDSSGGENWRSPNHVNRDGDVPCRFRGYELHAGGHTSRGNRASPAIVLAGERPLSATIPHFWQQFPKSLSSEYGEIRIGLFPPDWGDLHELQPGEQKTHTIWLSLDDDIEALDVAHRPPQPVLPPAWYSECELFEAFPDDAAGDSPRYRDYISTAIDPSGGLAARREVIDQYGWRNWGELWADHEQPRDREAPPVISHYNNQYDVIEGCLRHFARSGDRAWWDLALPLANHAIDIDTYHTDADRPVYNGGMFWHTDHYHTAGTATHRTYSRENAPRDGRYGGGPSSSHCYSTGYVHLYYLTGEPAYREEVLGLAEWLIAMEDGARTELCLVDDGPTGLSTISTEPWYHGPGRGPANTLNTLVDAWELTGDRRYRDHAETILRRVVSPTDDVDAWELLDIERRWFYILFLLSLAKYLDAKQAAGELDQAYTRGVAAARHYAEWMLKHERPYFEREAELEFPTETWGAQDIRKANAIRRLARYCDLPLAGRLREKGYELAERGWRDLLRFETCFKLRPLAILMIEGLRDEYFCNGDEPPPPSADAWRPESAEPPFRGQRQRVRDLSRSPGQLARSAMGTLQWRRWRRFIQAVRARL